MGSIAFRVNLFSALMGVVTLILLYWVSGCVLKLVKGEGVDRKIWPQLIPTGLFAFCFPFWGQTMQAEVYTLHTAFTCLLMGLLCEWRLKEDVRYLFAAALVLGLSSGNHATSGFYLPAVLWLFFFWCKEHKARLLSASAMFFLMGFLVYTYLPVRSYAEPSFDWGNPETVEGFVFQVTDRKDADYHFNYTQTTPLENAPVVESEFSFADWSANTQIKFQNTFWQTYYVLKNATWDLTSNLSYIAVPGLLLGGWICYRQNPGLLGFFALIAGINISFFMHWRQESYLPTYLVATILTSLALAHFLSPKQLTEKQAAIQDAEQQHAAENVSRRQTLVWLILALLIPYALAVNYFRVDRTGFYNAETLTKRMFLSLPDQSLFIPGLSWFNYYYHQDVERLRDDVTALPVWDLLNADPYKMITARRYPSLQRPDPSKFDFKTKQGIAAYVEKVFADNWDAHPVVMEHNHTFYEQTHLAGSMQPIHGGWLRFSPDSETLAGEKHWQDFHQILDEESKRSGSRRDVEWITHPWFILNSMVMYYHDTRRYDLEAKVLTFLRDDSPGWSLKWIENLLAQDKVDEARATLDRMPLVGAFQYEARFAEGLVKRQLGDTEAALQAFKQAANIKPPEARPYLEIAKTHYQAGQDDLAQKSLQQASERLQNVRQWVEWQNLKQKIQQPPQP